MLRASSLGLSFPIPTISALHTCRRLCGARARWVKSSPCPPRHASSSSSQGPWNPSLDVELVHLTPPSLTMGHQHPVQIQNPTLQTAQSPEGGDVPHLGENIHVAFAQHHRRLLETGQLEDDRESVEVRVTSRVSSIVRKETEGGDGRDGGIRVWPLDTVMSDPIKSLHQNVGPSKIQEGDLEPPDSPIKLQEKSLRGPPTRPQRQVVQDPPPYAAGKPWSPKPIMHSVIPGKTIHQIKLIANGLKIAHEQYLRQTQRREEKFKSPSTSRVDSPGNPTTTPTTTTTKSHSSSTEGDNHPVESEEDAENMEEPPPLETTVQIHEHLDILGTTDSVDTAWASYTYLIDTISCSPIIYNCIQHIPFAHLHRFARLLAHNRPRTYIQYLRLLSVMTYIVHVGGTLKQHQWNALIDHIGAGRRRTTDVDVERALEAYKSISAGRLPGASEFGLTELPLQSSFVPDVYTMTTLLSHASRARNPALLKQISTMMTQSGIAANRITHLSLLRYFTEKKDLAGLRRTLQKMRYQGLELGLDGLNACIWAYGYNNKLDIVLMIYRVLRHNKFPEDVDDSGPDDILETIAKLQEESIHVGRGLIPNEITYTALIQTMAYSGQFVPTIKIFFDMLSTENLEQGAPLQHSESGELVPEPYSASIAVYRAVFLGFSRHGKTPSLVKDHDELDWTLRNLLEIFERFLTIPDGTNLTHPVLNIIISAFVQTSGGDMDVLRRIWVALDNKFGIVFHKEHSESRLAQLKKSLFPDDQLTRRPD